MESQAHSVEDQRAQVSLGSNRLGRQVGVRCHCFQKSGPSDRSGSLRQAGEANRGSDCQDFMAAS